MGDSWCCSVQVLGVGFYDPCGFFPVQTIPAAQRPSGLLRVFLPTFGHNSHAPYHSLTLLWAALTRAHQARNILCHRLSLKQNPPLEPSEFPWKDAVPRETLARQSVTTEEAQHCQAPSPVRVPGQLSPAQGRGSLTFTHLTSPTIWETAAAQAARLQRFFLSSHP